MTEMAENPVFSRGCGTTPNFPDFFGQHFILFPLRCFPSAYIILEAPFIVPMSVWGKIISRDFASRLDFHA